MKWNNLTNEGQISQLVEASHNRPQLIFKHSTRCSISSMAKNRLEREWNLEQVDPWYLDLLSYRHVSNAVASQFNIQHESPQAIVLKEGKVVYATSHQAISAHNMAESIST